MFILQFEDDFQFHFLPSKNNVYDLAHFFKSNCESSTSPSELFRGKIDFWNFLYQILEIYESFTCVNDVYSVPFWKPLQMNLTYAKLIYWETLTDGSFPADASESADEGSSSIIKNANERGSLKKRKIAGHSSRRRSNNGIIRAESARDNLIKVILHFLSIANFSKKILSFRYHDDTFMQSIRRCIGIFHAKSYPSRTES